MKERKLTNIIIAIIMMFVAVLILLPIVIVAIKIFAITRFRWNLRLFTKFC